MKVESGLTHRDNARLIEQRLELGPHLLRVLRIVRMQADRCPHVVMDRRERNGVAR